MAALARGEVLDPKQKDLLTETQKQREVLINELKMKLIEFGGFSHRVDIV